MGPGVQKRPPSRRGVSLLPVLVCLFASFDGVAASGGRLHDEDTLARSGCFAVLENFAQMLRSPPEHIANKKVTVNVDGVDKEVPYTYTENFVNETIRLLCRSAGLARYNMVTTLLGEPLFSKDEAPDYKNTKPIHADLVTVCHRMVRRHRDDFNIAMSPGGRDIGEFFQEVCDGVCGPREPLVDRLYANLRRFFTSPRAIMRISPLFLVGGALPLILRPFVMGKPPLLQPRGNEDDYAEMMQQPGGSASNAAAGGGGGSSGGAERRGVDADDEPSVGCLPVG